MGQAERPSERAANEYLFGVASHESDEMEAFDEWDDTEVVPPVKLVTTAELGATRLPTRDPTTRRSARWKRPIAAILPLRQRLLQQTVVKDFGCGRQGCRYNQHFFSFKATTGNSYSDFHNNRQSLFGSFPATMPLQILVVEDHGDTRRVLAGLLGHFGHIISAADNVASALAFVKAKHFDAIVSDLGLPDGTGFDVIREAKRQQHLTGVALTARGEYEDIKRGRDAGFDYHLTKPIDFAQLRCVLERISPAGHAATA